MFHSAVDRKPGFLALVMEDLRTHREGLLAQGFWALLIYRFGHARLACRVRPLRAVWYVLHVVLCKFSEVFFGVYIGAPARIGRRLNIEHFGGIIIHGSAEIGDDCMIRQGVTLGNRYVQRASEAPRIGNGVDIGAGAKILGAVVVGNNAIIGANAVVIKDVPDDHVAVGVPARVFPRNSMGAVKLE